MKRKAEQSVLQHSLPPTPTGPPEGKIVLKPRQEAFYQRVRALYREAGITVPSLRDASRQLGAPPDAIRAMIRVGIERGEFADAGEGIYFPIETLQHLAEQLRHLPAPITVAKVRDFTCSSRRYAAAALRWLKRNGWIPL